MFRSGTRLIRLGHSTYLSRIAVTSRNVDRELRLLNGMQTRGGEIHLTGRVDQVFSNDAEASMHYSSERAGGITSIKRRKKMPDS